MKERMPKKKLPKNKFMRKQVIKMERMNKKLGTTKKQKKIKMITTLICMLILVLIVAIVTMIIIRTNIDKKSTNIKNKLNYEGVDTNNNDEYLKDIEELIRGENIYDYDSPVVYSEQVIKDFIKLKYGDEWVLMQKDNYQYQTNGTRYKFKRESNNDWFYVYSFSHEPLEKVGEEYKSTGKFIKQLDDTLYNEDIAISHIDEIKQVANEMGVTVEIDEKNNDLDQLCNIEIKMDSKEKINNIVDYVLKLDEILKLRIKEGTNKTFFKVKVKYGDKTGDLYIPQSDEEKERYTSNYYIAELQKL